MRKTVLNLKLSTISSRFYLMGQPNYKDCVRAIIRSFITIDEEFDLINSYNSYTKNLSTDSSIITDYQEYLTKLMDIKNKVKKDFGLVNK